jgi:tRNA(Ile)-lysidine synthase
VSGPDPAVAKVRLAVRRAISDLDPGALVLVACSGGADSLALVAATVFEGRSAALRVGAITVDHGLQEGSSDRAAALTDVLRARGLDPVEVVAVDVGLEGGPEAAARTARYDALDEAAERMGASAVLLGHTRDDQAETVLLGLARGSGARSLSGMARVSGHYRRPLLDLDRRTTSRAARAEGLEPWEDPHNADPAYARARVRADVLPAIERGLGPGIAAALARTAALLRADADALDEWADRAGAEAAHPDGGLDVTVLAQLPSAVRHRVLRTAALAAGCPAGALAAVHVDALDALVTSWHGQGPLHLPGGVGAQRACDRLSFLSRTLPEHE